MSQTNYVLNSNATSGGSWSTYVVSGSVTLTADVEAGPLSGYNATRHVYSTSSQTRYQQRTITSGEYGDWTSSFWIKAGVSGDIGKTIGITIGNGTDGWTDTILTLTGGYQRVTATRYIDSGTWIEIGVHTFAGATARDVLVSGGRLHKGNAASSNSDADQYLVTGTSVPLSAVIPALYSNPAPTFYAATISTGAVNLAPTRLDGATIFHAATVGRGSVGLTPTRLDGSATFYAATIGTGSVGLTPARLNNTEAFYAATVAANDQTLTATLYSNSSAFYAATIATGAVSLTPARYDSAQAFYVPTVGRGAVSLAPARLDNTSSFYAATVAPGAANLAPTRLDNSQTFHAATITTGAVDLAPTQHNNSQTFHAATVAVGATNLGATRLNNAQTFYAATVSPGPVDLSTTRAGWRPTSDVLTTDWTPSTGTDAYAMVDEETPSDADYVQATLSGVKQIIMGLSYRLPAGTHPARVRAGLTAGSGRVRARLFNDANVSQGDGAWQSLTTSPTTYEWSITTSGDAERLCVEVEQL